MTKLIVFDDNGLSYVASDDNIHSPTEELKELLQDLLGSGDPAYLSLEGDGGRWVCLPLSHIHHVEIVDG